MTKNVTIIYHRPTHGTARKRQQNRYTHIKQKKNPTQPAHNVGPPSACQRNAIKMAFRWRADGGPLLDINWEKNNQLSLHQRDYCKNRKGPNNFITNPRPNINPRSTFSSRSFRYRLARVFSDCVHIMANVLSSVFWRRGLKDLKKK